VGRVGHGGDRHGVSVGVGVVGEHDHATRHALLGDRRVVTRYRSRALGDASEREEAIQPGADVPARGQVLASLGRRVEVVVVTAVEVKAAGTVEHVAALVAVAAVGRIAHHVALLVAVQAVTGRLGSASCIGVSPFQQPSCVTA
jgi:hypothetical protein